MIDSRNKIGLGLFFGSFVVSRIDKREMKAEMREMKADMRAADLRMEIFRNETRADMKMDKQESRVIMFFTLLVAISAIVVPIWLK
jgi:formate-dependent nitrite reductase cytochrome c552 subunit